MVRVAVIEDKKLGAVNWWRCYRPLRYVMKRYRSYVDIDFIGTRFEITELMKYDVLIMFRPTDPQYAEVIRAAQLIGLKVILDVDDDLINLDPYHPLSSKYESRKSMIIEMYSRADRVWCSTEQLTYSMDCIGRSTIIPNAIDPSDLPKRPSKFQNIAMWRGSTNHIADFNTAAQWWADDHDARAKNWLWMGMRPYFVEKNVGRALPPLPILDYLDFLRKNEINYVWKPLEKNIFNDAKSNIAWIEATLAGAVCITNYESEQWEYAGGYFGLGEDQVNQLWQASCDAIEDNYNLWHCAELRYQDIIRLCDENLPTPNTEEDIICI